MPWAVWRRGVSGDLSLWDHSQLRFQCSGFCFASTITEFCAVIASALPSETHEVPIVFSSVFLLRMCDASIWVYSVCQFSWVAFSMLSKCFLNSSTQSRGHFHELRNLSSAASWIGGIFHFHDGEMGKTMACNMGTRSRRPFGSLQGVHRGVDSILLNTRRHLALLQCFQFHTTKNPVSNPDPGATPASTAFNLWDNPTDEQIFLASTSAPQALYKAMRPAPRDFARYQ